MKEADGKSGTLIPKVISVVAVIAMVAAFFLPFVSATGDYREWLLENPDTVQSEEISMTNADMADLSLLAYAVSYSHGEGIGMDGFESTFYMVLCALPLVLSVLGPGLVARVQAGWNDGLFDSNGGRCVGARVGLRQQEDCLRWGQDGVRLRAIRLLRRCRPVGGRLGVAHLGEAKGQEGL